MTPKPSRKKFRTPSLVALCAALTLQFAAPQAANAQPAPLANQQVELTAREQPVDDFIRDLFRQAGAPVVVSDTVTGTVNGGFSGDAAAVFQKISQAFNLVSYFDGTASYVYRADDISARTFAVSRDVSRKVRNSVRQLNLTNDLNQLKVADDGIIVATGAPSFLTQVSNIVTSQAARDVEKDGPLAFRVFPLQYAWAQDTVTRFANREVTVPGVASIVRSLVSTAPYAPLAIQSNRSIPALVPGVRPYRRYEISSPDRNNPPIPEVGGFSAVAGAVDQSTIGDVVYAPATIGGARIEADTRMNAVIVRDTAERMPIYEELIRSLDVEPQIVEIRATIIDVDTDRLRELGVQWRFTDSDDNVDVTFGGRATEGLNLSPQDFINPFSNGVLASGVIGDENAFSARIAALETDGAARVVSRPQVMTLGNVEAVFDNTQTFFVRVAGAVDVDLFNVSVGTTLSVTPHVLDNGGPEQIKLLVNVEDGQLSGGEVDGIPVIERSSVNTQALIEAGQSLLIGGLTVNRSEAFEDKVPFLGDIPLLGRAFKSRASRKGRVERLFLITPQLAVPGEQPVFEFDDEIDLDKGDRLSGLSKWSSLTPPSLGPAQRELSDGEFALLEKLKVSEQRIVLSELEINCLITDPLTTNCIGGTQ